MILPRPVYGFVAADCAEELLTDRNLQRRVRCVRANHVAVLVGRPALRLPAGNGVRRALGELRSYRRVLESVMRRVPVLPARFGSRLPGHANLTRLIGQHEDELGPAIAAYGHLLQMDIQVTGPQDHPDLCSRVSAARAQVRRELEGLCLAVHEEPAGSSRSVMNLTVLLRPLDEPRLDAVLARLDGEFGGWLHVACVGPLPPCNFIRVICSRASPKAAGPNGWFLRVDSTPHASVLPIVPHPSHLPASRAA